MWNNLEEWLHKAANKSIAVTTKKFLDFDRHPKMIEEGNATISEESRKRTNKNNDKPSNKPYVETKVTSFSLQMRNSS